MFVPLVLIAYAYVVALTSENGVDVSTSISNRLRQLSCLSSSQATGSL